MSIVFYFAAGLVIYSVIERMHDWRFLLAEAAGQAVFVGLAIWGLYRVHDPVIRGGLVGSSFWLFAVLVRLWVRRHPIEAAPLSDKSRNQIVPVGLIDFCWVGIMGGTLAFIVFAHFISPFSDPLPPLGLAQAYYAGLAENARFLLGQTIGGFFALGAVLGGSMAILWAGEIWRSGQSGDRMTYKRATVAAAKMVFAFFWTAFAVFLWIAWPLYEQLIAALAALR